MPQAETFDAEAEVERAGNVVGRLGGQEADHLSVRIEAQLKPHTISQIVVTGQDDSTLQSDNKQ